MPTHLLILASDSQHEEVLRAANVSMFAPSAVLPKVALLDVSAHHEIHPSIGVITLDAVSLAVYQEYHSPVSLEYLMQLQPYQSIGRLGTLTVNSSGLTAILGLGLHTGAFALGDA